MGLQTQSLDPFCVPRRQRHQSPLPAFGKCRGLLVNRVSVVTKSLVKLRVNADRIQPLGSLGALCSEQVHLRRLDDVVRKIRALPVKSLAPDYYELLLASYSAGSPQHVVKLLFLHRASSPRLAATVPHTASIAAVSQRPHRAPASRRIAHRHRHSERFCATRRRRRPTFLDPPSDGGLPESVRGSRAAGNAEPPQGTVHV